MKFILITIDSLRKTHLSYYNKERETTPFIDSLASQNTNYRNAYSASSHTREALPAILTGQNPEKCLNRYKIKEKNIAQKLQEKQITTKAFLSGPFLTEKNNYHKGFQKFDNGYKTRYTFPEYFFKIAQNQNFRSGYKLNKKIENNITQNSFIWAHYMDCHAPYTMFDEWIWGEETSKRKIQKTYRKAKYTNKATSSEKQLLLDAYHNSLRHLDEIIEDLFSRLDEDVKFILCADHGESFGEKGQYEHDFPRTLDQPRIEIPLIKKGVDKEIETKVSSLDIHFEILREFKFETGKGFDKHSSLTSTCSNLLGRRRRKVID